MNRSKESYQVGPTTERDIESRDTVSFPNEEQMRAIFESADVSLWSLDVVANSLVYCSPSTEKIYGVSLEQFRAQPDFWKMSRQADDVHAIEQAQADLWRGDRVQFDHQVTHSDGQPRWIQTRISPIMSETNQVIHLVGVSLDTTEQRLAQAHLSENETKFRELFHNANDAICLFNMEQGMPVHFLEVNDVMCSKLGYSREELLATAPFKLVNESPSAAEQVRAILGRERSTVEIHVYGKSHLALPVELSARVFSLNGAQVGMIIARDITDRKLAQAAIKNVAYHDELTGLPNRRLFKERLASAIEEAEEYAQRLAVLFLDLDRFREINDSLGHAFGDSVLLTMATRLQECVGSQNMIARMGGDEFAVLMPSLQRKEDALELAQSILAQLEVPVILEGYEFRITTSIGISLYPSDGADRESLMTCADTAMYRAKTQGNSYQFYASTMNSSLYKRFVLEESLRKALLQNEFEVYYQPRVDASSGQVKAVEALLRWKHPELGMVSPVDFIPLAEETGLIVPIGKWVLREACRQNRAWQEQGLEPVRVAVNFSARQLGERDIVKVIENTLHETGLEAKWLEIEITESTILHDVEATIVLFQTLKSMGAHISIDDFGTGYSSLSYLTRFKIDALKIDQSFVRDVTQNPENAAIATAVVNLAHSLQMDVVAEGVETCEQRDFLKQLQCHEMQGYLFSRPVPADQLRGLLAVLPDQGDESLN